MSNNHINAKKIDKNEIWNKLEKLGLIRSLSSFNIWSEGKHTRAHLIFNENMKRAITLIPEINNEIKTRISSRTLRLNHLIELTLIALITSLEVYLEDLFRDSLNYTNISKINKDYLIRFLEHFQIEKSYFEEYLKTNNFEFSFSKIFPKKKRLNFQDLKTLKVAYKSINIEIVDIIDEADSGLWGKIYSKEKDNPGYLFLRHKFIHQGWKSSIIYKEYLKPETIENAIIDIAKFINIIEKKILDIYPKKKYPLFYIQELKKKENLKNNTNN